MYTLVISLIIFAAVLLVLIILAQNSKGGGLSSQFGGSGASNLIGVKKTSDLLEKLTWGFAIAIMVLTMTSSMLLHKTGVEDDIIDRAQQRGTMPSLNLDSDLDIDEQDDIED
jgi:preprotein translocase subunit SecG